MAIGNRKLLVNGRTYEFVGAEDYTRKDGTATKLDRWLGECVTCGEPIIAKCVEGRDQITRWRCDRHKRPGTPATSEARARRRAGLRTEAA